MCQWALLRWREGGIKNDQRKEQIPPMKSKSMRMAAKILQKEKVWKLEG